MEHLKNNPLIVNIEPIQLTEDILATYNEPFRQRVIQDNQQVNMYRMTYLSDGHKVNGYIAEPTEGDNLPCIILCRGGAREFGIWDDKDVFNWLSHFTSLGYIVLATQYSGCAGSEGEEQVGGSEVQDILVLRELLQHNPRANADKIGLYGMSRGGMMIYRVLAEVNWIKAAVSRAGLSNMFRNYEMRPSVKEFHRPCYDVEDEQELTKRSAVCWPEKFCKTTPLLLIHGSRDNRVSVLDSLELATKLYEHKVPFRLNVYEGANHYIKPFGREEWKTIEQWFDRYLKNDEPLPELELEEVK